jgi:hypothetical protein
MAEFLACKASLNDGQPFEHAAEALAEWHPEGMEFLCSRPDPDRQIDAPARNVVEYREVLGDMHRIMQRQQQHVSANADALSARRDRRQERDRRRAPRVGREMVLARPYRIEAELFGQDRLIEEVAIDLVHRLRAARQLANSHADDELHAASPIAPIRVQHGSPMSPPQRRNRAVMRRVRPVRLRCPPGASYGPKLSSAEILGRCSYSEDCIRAPSISKRTLPHRQLPRSAVIPPRPSSARRTRYSSATGS